jgi:hypothetical protein
MSEQWRLEIQQVLRRRRLDIIVIGGLGVMMLMCVWSEIMAWPLLPTHRSALSGSWRSDSGVSIDLNLTFAEHTVRIASASKSYPISLTDSLIIYSDHQQQSYRFGWSLSSLLIFVDRPPQLVITSPGPIPEGIYTHQVFIWTSGPEP